MVLQNLYFISSTNALPIMHSAFSHAYPRRKPPSLQGLRHGHKTLTPFMFMKTQKQIHDHRRFRQPASSPKIPSAPCVRIMNPACRTPSPPPPHTSPYAAYLYIKLLNQPHPARVAATSPAPATSQRQTRGPENAPGTTAENLPTVHTARPMPRLTPLSCTPKNPAWGSWPSHYVR